MMTTLSQMPPSLPGQYAGDLRLTDFEPRGYLTSRSDAPKRLDFSDLALGQFGPAMRGAFAGYTEAIGGCVRAVLAGRTPFKIIGSVVRLVSILVVDLRLGVRVRNEGCCDQSMDEKPNGLSFFTERDPVISRRVRESLKKPRNTNAATPAILCQRKYTSEVRNFVKAFIAHYSLPDFHVTSSTIVYALGYGTPKRVAQHNREGI